MTIDEEIAQLYTDITQINVTLSKWAKGEVVKQMRIGSGDSQREYQFEAPNAEQLLALRSVLQNRLNDLLAIKNNNCNEVSFKQNGYIPLRVQKRD